MGKNRAGGLSFWGDMLSLAWLSVLVRFQRKLGGLTGVRIFNGGPSGAR